MKLIKNLWEQRLVRFLAVGCFNTVFDISLLLFFFKIVGLPELVANTLSVSIAVSVSYVLNHKVVFRHPQNYSFANYLRFFAVTGFSIIVIQDLVIYVVTKKLWVLADAATVTVMQHQLPAKTLELLGAKASAVVFGLAWNFLLYKYVVFRGSKPDEADELTLV